MSTKRKLIKTIIWGILVIIMAFLAIHSLIVKDYWLLGTSLTALIFDIVNFHASLNEWKQSK